MKCEEFNAIVDWMQQGGMPASSDEECRAHAAGCADCADVLAGAGAIGRLRVRDTGHSPEGLFARLVDGAVPASRSAVRERRFWQGAGFGGAVGAALLAAALVILRPDLPAVEPSGPPEFMVVVNERRLMDLAIESDRPLENARISIELSGGVELDGYGLQRVVEWNADLKAGVNRLSLPVIAVDPDGGRMVVRLSHPKSEQVFVVRLKTQV